MPQHYDQPLSDDRLFGWHNVLFPTGRSGFYAIEAAKYRSGEMQVVSGPMGHEKVHYEAPKPERVPEEMHCFIDWVNADNGTDPVLKAGIAHLWFVSIHPFDDGNGRITRDITAWLLWFLDCFDRALSSTEETLASVLAKARFWESHRDLEVNERQRKIINMQFDGFFGKLTSGKWAKIGKCSTDTALNDIKDLVEKGVLRKNDEGGRSTNYSLVTE